ncbi:MAG: membrane protein insertion efficiency factor YidD [Spirochaetaceae bacterium]|nr:MAG: membrane protein insertion efficiency factor YidD [Spirochaetaceae bacterium]
MESITRSRRFIRTLAALPIHVYQQVISPWTRGSCLYHPTCSEYGKQALLHHGVVKGTILTLARIGRCQGLFFAGGDDPVPEVFTFRSIRDSYSMFRRRRSQRPDQ